MAPIAMVPFIAYNPPVTHNHWSGSPTPGPEPKAASGATATGIARKYDPQYYSEGHRSRDQELEAQFKAELKALRNKYKEDSWTRLWNLSRKFREQFDQTFVDEEKALETSFDEVIRGNIRDNFFGLRHDLIEAYKLNKQLIPTELGIECEREEQQLRDKFYELSNNIKREAKAEFHLEIFDKILVLDPSSQTPVADQASVNSEVVVSLPEQHTETVAEEPAREEAAPETPKPNNLEEINQFTESSGTEEPVQKAASVNSKTSSGAASKRSTSSAKSRRSDQGSTHTSIRLQETPLLIKPPVNLTVTTEESARPAVADPVPVKRNFWGKIIS